jgi:hypothetical protein
MKARQFFQLTIRREGGGLRRFSRARRDPPDCAEPQKADSLPESAFLISMNAVIHKPERPTEFEMQAELYFRLKKLGLDVRGEVSASFDGGRSFFDLVVFHGHHGAVIIEVKNNDAGALRYGKKTRQNRKYKSYGLPLVYFTTATPIESVIAEIQKHIKAI